MTNITITQELVQYLFDYKDGELYYKNKTSNRNTKPIGSKAGYIRPFNNCDRYVIKINGKDYMRASIVFLYHKGYIPFNTDHENHDTLNDKIDNLRAATKSQNNKNTSSRKGSTSKYLGVCWSKQRNLWCASIWVNNTSLVIGFYNDEQSGALAYNREAVRYHKEFANLNICK